MKYLIYIFMLFFSIQQVSAQGIFSKERVKNRENHDKQMLRWGYYLGLNSLDFDFNYIPERANIPTEIQDIQTTKQVGFNVGLIGNLRINDHLDIRTEPGVIFNTRTLMYPGDELERGNIRELNTTAVHIPLLLKISTKRLNNFKPFIVGGVSTSINLSSNEDNPNDNRSGQFRTKTNYNNYELGFGIDFFLPYFKFTPSVRGVFSLTNELVPDEDPDSEYTSFIDDMETRGIFINFTFQ